LTPLPEESPPGASKIRNSGGSSSDTEKTDEPPQQTQQARHNVPPPTPSHELLLSPPPPPPPPPPHELPARGATAAFKAALASAGVEAEGAAAAPNVEQMVQNRCKKLRDKFGVQPGVTWGTLPMEMQKYVLTSHPTPPRPHVAPLCSTVYRQAVGETRVRCRACTGGCRRGCTEEAKAVSTTAATTW
jgi:hypothetical protein